MNVAAAAMSGTASAWSSITMSTDYTTVTESPENRASQDQLSRLYHRYRTAAHYCANKDVLEVACGAGMGLGYLAQTARSIVGGDYSQALLNSAHSHYHDRIPLIRFDAESLPFSDKSFDVIILFEAIYYLKSPQSFLNESRRVLKDGGVILICTVNRAWTDFNPSPLAQKYLLAPDLVASLRHSNFDVKLFGAYPALPDSMRDRSISAIKRMAVALNLMPKTMKGKELLKRVFFGELQTIPYEISDGLAEYRELYPISCEAGDSDYKILYAVGYAR